MALVKAAVVCRVERHERQRVYSPSDDKGDLQRARVWWSWERVLGVRLTESVQTQLRGGGKNNFFMLSSSGCTNTQSNMRQLNRKKVQNLLRTDRQGRMGIRGPRMSQAEQIYVPSGAKERGAFWTSQSRKPTHMGTEKQMFGE